MIGVSRAELHSGRGAAILPRLVPAQNLRHQSLPDSGLGQVQPDAAASSFALGLGSLATVSRLMRTSMLDVLGRITSRPPNRRGPLAGQDPLAARAAQRHHAGGDGDGPDGGLRADGQCSSLRASSTSPVQGKYLSPASKTLTTMIGGTVVFSRRLADRLHPGGRSAVRLHRSARETGGAEHGTY